MSSGVSGGSGQSSPGNRGNKQKRIEKELLQLRNLPREIKLGKRETSLGILLYVSYSLYCLICMHLA